MLDVTYSADVSTIDQPPYAAKAERPDKPIRIRVPLLLFRLKEGATPGTGMYRSWNNVSWILEVPTAAEAILLRDTLQLFFSTIASEGIAATHGYLTGPIEPA